MGAFSTYFNNEVTVIYNGVELVCIGDYTEPVKGDPYPIDGSPGTPYEPATFVIKDIKYRDTSVMELVEAVGGINVIPTLEEKCLEKI